MENCHIGIQLSYGGYMVWIMREEGFETHIFTDLDNAMKFVQTEILLFESTNDDNESNTDSVEEKLRGNKK